MRRLNEERISALTCAITGVNYVCLLTPGVTKTDQEIVASPRPKSVAKWVPMIAMITMILMFWRGGGGRVYVWGGLNWKGNFTYRVITFFVSSSLSFIIITRDADNVWLSWLEAYLHLNHTVELYNHPTRLNQTRKSTHLPSTDGDARPREQNKYP